MSANRSTICRLGRDRPVSRNEMCRPVEPTCPARLSWLNPRCIRHCRSRAPNGLAADQVWDVIGRRFDRISDWATPLDAHHSEVSLRARFDTRGLLRLLADEPSSPEPTTPAATSPTTSATTSRPGSHRP